MGQISRQLAAQFQRTGKQRNPLRYEAKNVRESAQIPKDVKSIEQCVKSGMDPLAGLPDVRTSLPHGSLSREP